jgi:ribose transport system ATP-binding protein
MTPSPGAPGMPRFEMHGIVKRYGATVALAGVDLSVAPGEVCGLIGENGAGKSTLMAILAGALRPDAGTMRLDGAAFAPASPMASRRAGVAMIYQELSIAPDLSVAENILLGVEPSRMGVLDRFRMRQIAATVLGELGRSHLDPDSCAGDLAIADQQLVEVARAVATGSRVLVLDEPTSSLGHGDAARLFALVRRLRGSGHAVVYISHFIEEVRAICDRITVLRDGRVAGGGSAAMGTTEIVRLMVGRDIDELFPRTARRQGEALLQLESVQPGHASLALHRGEVLGIAGLVGAGRTELLRAIFGLDRVRAGTVRVGAYSGIGSPLRRWAQGVGMVSEDRKGEGVALDLDVADNITLTKLPASAGGLVLPRGQHAAAARWIDRLSIKVAGPTQAVAELSGGNQQKVALARLLHHDVDVLLLDEPTRGIDIGSKAQIYATIDALVSERPPDGRPPRAVLLVSSQLSELLGLCDRIAVMHRGHLGPCRPVAEWDEHTLMLAATGAGAAA